MKNNMPPNWQPPAPAWQALWNDKEDLRVAYFAAQSKTPELLDAWQKRMLVIDPIPLPVGPLMVERGHFVDAAGQENFLLITYWRESHYQNWWSTAKNSWYQFADSSSLGVWRETMRLPHEHFETLLSSPDAHGLASSGDDVEGPILEHGYPGGMRDRIEYCALSDVRGGSVPRAEANENDDVVRVLAPANLCMIRSGQDWGFCDDEQADDYLSNVHPVLQKGMNYLRDRGEECGCYSMRLVDVLDEHWKVTKQTFGLGYAKDIFVFEDWAKSHPTHLDIFGKFMVMAEKYGESLQLQLWHEVAVCPDDGGEFEYIQCHDKTGILPFVSRV
ncbi:phenylacetaldoxime dehydratase family protein [Pseudoteredinibacter isoporae]|uniref:Aldoxime dehydratase n=1 Tax=Pseudoteredinibacter isoporae TaxID=570281 RepID=A0A7X0JTS6_9GAMM|nr:phenylacetaldoxime dehydratase family protein [Pseudoteredinibacter isoporae]MBB6521699.1 aldoxime dehydratase [Pseudoteredinibacter isoporae]NHO87247.1 phenylacetaldoxime dehydratase family protein [Pseudoteredinibacter isoporae]NIB23121.1 phenylacetaldoxime dehydratase family protein [Pseudoteredinibacter isoporae]